MTKLNKIQKEALGTIITIETNSSIEIINKCFIEINRIEKKYSRFLDSSFLSKLNKNLNKEIILDRETLNMFKSIKEVENITNNYFDITIKSDLEKLGYDKNLSLKKKFNFNFLKQNKRYQINNNKIILSKEIDLGGFGKGYAILKVKEILDKNKISYYFINAGGDIFIKSTKKEKIALENPKKKDFVFGEVELDNESICSSSSNRRMWGKNLHHLINPFTRKPQNNINSVFVIHKDPQIADSLCTGLFVMGFDKAITCVKENNLQALLISKEDKIYSSKEFKWKMYQ